MLMTPAHLSGIIRSYDCYDHSYHISKSCVFFSEFATVFIDTEQTNAEVRCDYVISHHCTHVHTTYGEQFAKAQSKL